ncbi:MAG: structural protein P5 [Bacteroidales bacterium]|nr:structural protein P5 [Bacteroidales bacterium]
MLPFITKTMQKDWARLLIVVFQFIFHKHITTESEKPNKTEPSQPTQNPNAPRGYRNNNPLNIRHSNDYFHGEITGTDKAFKTFSCMPYGYRVAFVILHTYLLRGANTIEKIISRWSPPTENDTENYIATVEKFSGIPRNKELTASDGADYILIVSAMSFMESGTNADISEIKAGFNLQSKFKMQ